MIAKGDLPGDMEWYGRLTGEALRSDGDEFSLLYHAALRPAAPPEYLVPGMVGLTFRLHRRPDHRLVFATLLDLPAVVRLGERLGLDPAAAVAFVDSHERIHVRLQLEGVRAEVEEDHSRFVDAVWLSLHNPLVEALVRAGEFGLVEKVGPDFWERLVDITQETDAPAPPCAHARTEVLLHEEEESAVVAADAPGDKGPSLLRCLDCDAHLLVETVGTKDQQPSEPAIGLGRVELRLIPMAEAQERLARAGRRA